MHKIVVYISLFIWFIYFILLTNREIFRKNKDKEKYNLNFLKKNVFYLFRLDSLFFLVMFYIYKGFNNDSVTIYLYFVFVVSSLVFILYDLNEKYDIKKNKFKKEKWYYFVAFLMLLIPLVYYLVKKDIASTCFYTLLINFLLPIAIFFTKLIKSRLKK